MTNYLNPASTMAALDLRAGTRVTLNGKLAVVLGDYLTNAWGLVTLDSVIDVAHLTAAGKRGRVYSAHRYQLNTVGV